MEALEAFKNTVLNAYGAIKGEGDGALAWCVITGKWYPISNITACYIVNIDIGELGARCLFGDTTPDDNSHLMSAANGIPIHKDLAKWITGGQVAIVPDEDYQNIHL
jgi:hypothetical protein